jgi:hypothetical protein
MGLFGEPAGIAAAAARDGALGDAAVAGAAAGFCRICCGWGSSDRPEQGQGAGSVVMPTPGKMTKGNGVESLLLSPRYLVTRRMRHLSWVWARWITTGQRSSNRFFRV